MVLPMTFHLADGGGIEAGSSAVENLKSSWI